MALSPGCAACHAQGILPLGLPSGLGGQGQFAAGERLAVWGGRPTMAPPGISSGFRSTSRLRSR